VRDAAGARSSKLPEQDALRARLQQLRDDMDQLRGKIVATKEGGMVTGEERIRELLGNVYGNVNGYDGRPTNIRPPARTLLPTNWKTFSELSKLAAERAARLECGAGQKKLDPIQVMSPSTGRSSSRRISPAAAHQEPRPLPGETERNRPL